jgi:hypothetical protein
MIYIALGSLEIIYLITIRLLLTFMVVKRVKNGTPVKELLGGMIC